MEAPVSSPELELLRGTLDLLILKTLSWAPMHGLAVLRWIESATRERLQIEEGALYPALHRLEQKRWLDAEWGYTDQGRKAKFYRLTPAGRKQLAAEVAKWTRYTETVGFLLAAEPAR
jgi:PadR family transcriptional regulator, regulatory protein PadR